MLITNLRGRFYITTGIALGAILGMILIRSFGYYDTQAGIIAFWILSIFPSLMWVSGKLSDYKKTVADPQGKHSISQGSTIERWAHPITINAALFAAIFICIVRIRDTAFSENSLFPAICFGYYVFNLGLHHFLKKQIKSE